MHLLLLFLGAMLFLAFSLNKAFPRQDFSWRLFVKKNLFSTVVNLIVGVILILSKEDLATIFPIKAVYCDGGVCWWNVVEVYL